MSETPSPPQEQSSPPSIAEKIPELKLSKRQRDVLGITKPKREPTDKEKERNAKAAERLRAYHADRKAQESKVVTDKVKTIEASSRVRIKDPDPPKKRAKHTRVKSDSEDGEAEDAEESESESEPDSEQQQTVRKHAKKATKTIKAIKKLDKRIREVSRAQPTNPYTAAFHALLGR